MRERIAVLKKDLLEVMLLLKDNNEISNEQLLTGNALESRAENRRKAIKKLQHLTGISDAELNDLYWKKQYSGE